jgi:signal transduction histidine kinase
MRLGVQMCDNTIVKLRITTLLIIGMTFIGLVVVLLGNLNAILIPFFQRQEQSTAVTNVLRGEAILEKTKQELGQKTAYLAHSSQSMVYPQNGTQQWLSRAFSPDAYTDLRLNLIAVLDPGTHAITGELTTGGGTSVQIPAEWQNALFNQPAILELAQDQTNRVGFLKVKSQLYMLCIQTMQDTSLLVTGVSMDSSAMTDLADQVLFPIRMIPMDESNPPSQYAGVIEELQTSSTPVTRILSTEVIAGYALVYGMDKSQVALLEVSSNRTTYQGSQLVLNYLIVILVSATAIFSLMTYLLVQYLILNRVTRLSKEVARIGAEPSQPGRVTVTRKDELSILAQNINSMLAGLDQARADLEKSFSQVQIGRKRLEDLSRRLVTIQEEERHTIALELHDEIGQMLTGLKLKLANISTLPKEKVQEQLRQAQTMTNDLINKVRQLSLDLRPSMLDDLGLLPAVQWLTTQYSAQTGIRVDLTHKNVEGRRFTPEVEITAYRIIQEGLTNVARHAHVKKAQVNLSGVNQFLKIQIRDQGAGFSPKIVLQKGETSGLSGIRERVAMLGGNFVIQSKPNQETTLTTELPIAGHLERRKHDRSHPAGG